MESELKKCSKCGEVKARTEFHKNSQRKDGTSSQCKCCVRLYHSKYRKANPDKVKAKSAKYYRANTEKEKARCAKYRKENAEKERERHAKYRNANLEKERTRRANYYRENKSACAAYSAMYYRENKDKVNARNSKYHAANPEKARASKLRRRARLVSASGDHTAEQLKARFDYHGNKCVYCDSTENLHADHQIPLSRGGTNFASNMVPACATCNISKGSKTPEEFLVYQFNIAMEKLING